MTQTPTFKYYRRGTGELDTSNFPEIVRAGVVAIDHLDSRTLAALQILSDYAWTVPTFKGLRVIVGGYVCHMRGDKDVYDPSVAYEYLKEAGFTFEVLRVQHDSRHGIESGVITKRDVNKDLHTGNWFTRYLGADSSVHKFFPEVESEARKIRKDGKVTDLELDLTPESLKEVCNVVIVDDILGGGATIQACVDRLRELGYEGKLSLWVEWNEGIHKPEFLEQFTHVYLGRNIYEVN